MNSARIVELLEPFLRVPIALPGDSSLVVPRHSGPAKAGEETALLSPAQLLSISTYMDILIRWNARINLTAIRDPEDIVTRHFGESLFAASRLFPAPSSVLSVSSAVKAVDSFADIRRDSTRASAPKDAANDNRPATHNRFTVADIGSGAGFPGLPIKLWEPRISLTLIESNHKKAAFLREVTRALTLTNVNIENTRAETLTGRTFDVVTLRAVERFESILSVAAAMVAPVGRLALLIGSSQQDRARTSLPQFAWSEAVRVPVSRARVLLLGHCR